jgi:glycopeptide antibiotics resistance protein
MRKTIIAILTLAYAGVIAAMTLGPQPGNGTTAGWAQAVIGLVDRHVAASFSYADLEFFGNIALFAPLGFLLILLLGRNRWWVVVLLGIAATCGIEFSQHFIPNRVPDVRDLVANSAGALIGVLLGLPFARVARPRGRVTSRSRPALGT